MLVVYIITEVVKPLLSHRVVCNHSVCGHKFFYKQPLVFNVFLMSNITTLAKVNLLSRFEEETRLLNKQTLLWITKTNRSGKQNNHQKNYVNVQLLFTYNVPEIAIKNPFDFWVLKDNSSLKVDFRLRCKQNRLFVSVQNCCCKRKTFIPFLSHS